MRNVLLLSLVLSIPVVTHAQSTSAQTPPKTGTPAPPARTGGASPTTPAQPRPRTTTAAPAQGSRSGVALTVLGADGKMLEGIHVQLTGPMERTGDTNNSGQVNFPGLPAGTYRLRFSGDAVVTFEREAVLAGGKVSTLQVTLNAAEAKKEEPKPKAPVAPPAPAIGPVGSAQLGSLTQLAKRAQQSKPIQRELLLACSGNSRSVLVLLTEDQPQRVYDDAETTYYVLDGQGAVKIGETTGDIAAGSFFSVPRGMPFSVTRRGNKPLVMLWVLNGSRCEAAR